MILRVAWPQRVGQDTIARHVEFRTEESTWSLAVAVVLLIRYLVVFLRVRRPSASGITPWVERHTSQAVCPWNVKFAQELADGSAFASRAFIAGKDARTLAREILAMVPADYAAAFKGSAMKRAKLGMLQRNAVVASGNLDGGLETTGDAA